MALGDQEVAHPTFRCLATTFMLDARLSAEFPTPPGETRVYISSVRGIGQIKAIERQFHPPKVASGHVRFGSLADILRDLRDVRFTPKSGHR